MALGRPTTYTPEVVEAAWLYIDTYEEHGHNIPSVAGLCQVIKRSRSIVYDWAKDPEKEFSDILDALLEKQEQKLVDNGLSGAFNSTITKLILTKHGYSDKQDNTVSGPDGGPIKSEVQWTIQPVKPVNEADAES